MYLITGYNGFIAKNFLKYTQIRKEQIIKIKRNIKKLKKIKKKNITIINFASFYQKETHSNDISKVVDANFTYPIKIIKTLLEQKNKIIFFNIASYFQLKENFKKKSNFYSINKNSFIYMLKYFEKKNHLKYFNIYLYDVFGHNDERDKIFNVIINNYKKKKKLKVNYPNNLIAPTYIVDVCDVINKYIFDKNRPKNIHINYGKTISIYNLCNLAKSVLKNFKFRVTNKNNNNKDFIKIYKMKKYFLKNKLKDILINFFEKYA